MALITCPNPNCGRQGISDSGQCPSCGCNPATYEQDTIDKKMKEGICPECNGQQLTVDIWLSMGEKFPSLYDREPKYWYDKRSIYSCPNCGWHKSEVYKKFNIFTTDEGNDWYRMNGGKRLLCSSRPATVVSMLPPNKNYTETQSRQAEEQRRQAEEQRRQEEEQHKCERELLADFNYSYTPYGINITEYKGNGGDVIIPSIVGRKYVTSLGRCIFRESDTSPKRVMTKEEQKKDYAYAQKHSRDLSQSITRRARLHAEGYTTNGIVKLIAKPDKVFSNCASLTSITIPESVTSIGNNAFGNCVNLTSIIIPNSVTSIGGSAFCRCTNLTSIVIPDSITIIGERVFEGCTSLTSITISNSITGIADSMFSCCTNLTSIAIPDSVTEIGDRAFYNCAGLTSITIPNRVTFIGEGAFEGCINLAQITIPDSVLCIDYGAFSYCTSLTSITIPDSVTIIGGRYGESKICEIIKRNSLHRQPVSITDNFCSSTFSDCTNLTDVTIGKGVVEIGSSAFKNCPIETLNINMPIIPTNVFLNNSTIKNLIIGSNVKSIEEYAFSNCTALTSVTIYNSIKNIGSGFPGCINLTSITFHESVTSIGEYEFADCDFTSITIPESVKIIKGGAFANCVYLTSVTFKSISPQSLEHCFTNCNNLKTIYVPNGTKQAYKKAFNSFKGVPFKYRPRIVEERHRK